MKTKHIIITGAVMAITSTAIFIGCKKEEVQTNNVNSTSQTSNSTISNAAGTTSLIPAIANAADKLAAETKAWENMKATRPKSEVTAFISAFNATNGKTSLLSALFAQYSNISAYANLQLSINALMGSMNVLQASFTAQTTVSKEEMAIIFKQSFVASTLIREGGSGILIGMPPNSGCRDACATGFILDSVICFISGPVVDAICETVAIIRYNSCLGGC